ncbi:MAG: undecaprenyl-phosphate glucose phosphotransferase [Rhodobiaceae bacterium]|nr:undecaprenyl-phosphate glucose phosphotransferase [Rhodobiaceae bacterium]
MQSLGSEPAAVAAASKTALQDTSPERRRAPRSGVILNPDAREAANKLRADHTISHALVASVACLLEFFSLLALGTAIFTFHVYEIEGMASHYLVSLALLPVLALIGFQAANLYTVAALRSPTRAIAHAGLTWTAVFALLAVFVFFMKTGDYYSRAMYGTWYLTGLAALLATRLTMFAIVRRWSHAGRLDRRTVIVGGGHDVESLVSALDASAEADIQIVGIFDDRDDERSPLVQAGYRKLGTTDELVEFIRMTHVDLLIVSLPITAEKRLLQMLQKLWVLPVDVRLSAHTNKLRFKPRAYSYIGNIPFLDVIDRPLGDWDHVLKNLFDKTFALLALLLLSPIMIGTALAVKLTSKGPIFFRQNRYGFNNELIGIYKFRSMYTDMSDVNASKLVTKDDPRVTPVGRFIRKTSIDELPQLFNVLMGELSLVGPRPHAVQAKAADELYDAVVDGYFARHRVKPGITGWAQINGWRGETDTREKIERRVEHDLFYIENWSVFFDLYILAATPLKLLHTESAY